MHVQFAELPVFDQDRAKAFYTTMLNCQVVADVPMGPSDWRWIEVKFEGAQTALHFVRQDEVSSTDTVLVLIAPNVAEAINALRAKGVTILSEPAPAPYDPSRIVAGFRDSEGNRIDISDK